MRFLFDAAVRTLVLHSPGEVYPGPYTYKRFWFRDAAFMLNALLVLGGVERTRHVLRHFAPRQRRDGYFLSQEGEWDSNGEAIWIQSSRPSSTSRATTTVWVRWTTSSSPPKRNLIRISSGSSLMTSYSRLMNVTRSRHVATR